MVTQEQISMVKPGQATWPDFSKNANCKSCAFWDRANSKLMPKQAVYHEAHCLKARMLVDRKLRRKLKRVPEMAIACRFYEKAE